MNREGLNRLRIAIVKRAAEDYLNALRVLHDYEDNEWKYANNSRKREQYRRAGYMVAECETFFIKDISCYANLDGEWIIGKLEEKSRDKSFRIHWEDGA